MTIEQIRNSSIEFLTPKEIAEALRVDPQNIRVQAKNNPSALGFPVSVIGSRIHIPRAAFIKWFDGGM